MPFTRIKALLFKIPQQRRLAPEGMPTDFHHGKMSGATK